MKHLAKLFLTLFLIATLVLGVLEGAPNKKTSKPDVKKPKTPVSNHLTSPVTQGVVVVDTTSSFSILGDLSWLFTQVHFVALLVSFPLIISILYVAPLSEIIIQTAGPNKEKNSDRIKRVVKGVFKSLCKPKVHSMLIISLLICRYIPLDFTVESLFGLNKYYGYSATVKFTRLVAAFYFASYIYHQRRPFMKEIDSKPSLKQYSIAVSLGCLSYFLPVISVGIAALGELISFCLSKYKGGQPKQVTKSNANKWKEQLHKELYRDIASVSVAEKELIIKILNDPMMAEFNEKVIAEFLANGGEY